MEGRSYPAVYFKKTFTKADFRGDKMCQWQKNKLRIQFANKQYFPNDLLEVVLD